VRAVSQDLFVPAETEIVLEGVITPDATMQEGPFGEFVGFLSPQGMAPVLKITAVTRRRKPIYHAINGFGRETIMLRKYVLEASLLSALQPAFPFVTDVEMTAGGLHRFHVVLQVRKSVRQHDGLQRNAMLGCFATLKDLDLVIAVDDDIDIQDPADVEYALATRFEASQDIVLIPGARGHEYVRASKDGIRAKMGLDATVPFAERDRFRRAQFADVALDRAKFVAAAGGPFMDYLTQAGAQAEV
jgi:2,5-furandicarboxylate decarboxylase 1